MIIRYLFLMVLCCLPYCAWAQYRSEVLTDVSYVQFDGDRLVYLDTTVIRINERMGDHDAKDRIYFQKGEKSSFGDIWIEDVLGNKIRKLRKNEIEESSSVSDFSLYEDRMVKSFEAKHHHYPYRVSYTKKLERKRFTNIISLDYSGTKTPVKNGLIVLQHPLDQPVKQRIENIDEYMVDTVGQMVYHKFRYSYQPNIQKEKFASVNTSTAPQIIIAPIEFKYGVRGRNETWQDFGNWIYELNRKRDDLPLREEEKIDQLVEGLESERQKIHTLYKYLQENTRYVNVSTHIGGLQTHSAGYVVQNGYGDCKALTNYMQSMLKYVGIDSYYTLIYNDEMVHDLDDDFSYNAFNHVILSVPLEGDTLFLECTSKNSPMGYIGTSNQGRRALLVKENGSKLISTSKMNATQVLCTRDFDLNIPQDSESSLVLKVREKGRDYERLNAYAANGSRNTIDYFVREYVLTGSFEMTNYQIEKENSDSASIDITINYKMNNLCKKYGSNLALSPFPIHNFGFEEPDKRTQDLQIDYPIYKKDKLKVYFEGSDISKLPADIEYSSPYGDYYKVSYNKEGADVIIEKEFLITDKRLSVDEYKDFYLFTVKVKNAEISNIYFEVL